MTEDLLWDKLLLHLYAAVTDESARDSLPGLIARWTGGTTAALWITDQSKQPVEVPLTNGPVEGAALYAANYYQHDPWASQFFSDNTGAVVRGSQSISDTLLERSVFYNDFAKQFDLFHQVNTTFAITSQGEASHLYSTLSVMRAKRVDGFSDDEVARLERLVPHLKQATTLRFHLARTATRTRDRTLAGFIDSIGNPACVLDGTGRVLHANQAAARMDCIHSGVALRGGIADQVIGAAVPAQRRRLLAAIADAASGRPGAVLRLSTDEGHDVQALVTPLPAQLPSEIQAGSRGFALLVLRPIGNPDRAVVRHSCTEMFGFTTAEAEVAVALAQGRTPQDVADSRGTRVSTVRTLLERAQSKTGTTNLRQLVAKLASL